MGDFAEMALDGMLCERCGEFLDGEMPGYPRMCSSCASEFEQEQIKYKKKRRITNE